MVYSVENNGFYSASLDQTMLFMFGGAVDSSLDEFDSYSWNAHGCKQLSDEAPSGLQWTWGDFWMYDRNTSTFSQLWPTTLPKPRAGAVSWTDIHGVAYVFGGGTSSSVCSALDNLLDGFFFILIRLVAGSNEGCVNSETSEIIQSLM